jgi:predicted ABC-type ATPase
MDRIKRLRIFAGPNGSGKTTLYNYFVKTNVFNDYYFINADIINTDLSTFLNFGYFPIKFSETDLYEFLDNSSFQLKMDFKLSETIEIKNSIISLKENKLPETTYISAALSEFLRKKMIMESNSSFAFETVFSHKSKLEEIKFAKENGYKVYLYFIATDDVFVNLERIQGRIVKGGHFVPVEKIRDRYLRSLDNLFKAIILADKVFFFDNSGQEQIREYSFFAEKKNNALHILNGTIIPWWFNEYVLQKIFYI